MLAVLVVVDDELSRLTLARMLADPRIVLATAATVAEASLQLSSRPFGAILLDYYLQPSCGMDLVPLARSQNPLSPILVHSALPDWTMALRALRLGATDFAAKVTDPDAYLDFVRGRALISERARPVDGETLEEARRRLFFGAFRVERGNVRGAARRSGIARTAAQRIVRTKTPPAGTFGGPEFGSGGLNEAT